MIDGRIKVALRKESVDRNHMENNCVEYLVSLSARRAWIEICTASIKRSTRAVALRKESVDRNAIGLQYMPQVLPVALRKESVDRNASIYRKIIVKTWSLSARRAWIEMLITASVNALLVVALRKESVDRNSMLKE